MAGLRRVHLKNNGLLMFESIQYKHKNKGKIVNFDQHIAVSLKFLNEISYSHN